MTKFFIVSDLQAEKKIIRVDSCLDLALPIEGKICAIFSKLVRYFLTSKRPIGVTVGLGTFVFFYQERIIQTTAMFYYSKKYSN